MRDPIDERDDREEQVADMARQAGCEEEFSNLHDHRECVAECVAVLKAEIARQAQKLATVESERIFRSRERANSERPTAAPLSDGELASTISGLLSYRQGVATFPRDCFEAQDAVEGLPIEARRYLATGAWNLHRKIDEIQGEARKLREALNRIQIHCRAVEISDDPRAVEQDIIAIAVSALGKNAIDVEPEAPKPHRVKPNAEEWGLALSSRIEALKRFKERTGLGLRECMESFRAVLGG